ncbi:hypothetical protein VQH23_23870 [Pararoseomonas sp. SCSIO 73927]|uniref:hypothetical protein n=1 Tax=Pararoseomonas sp. SCSIO 73927 TaxID=3114537 RepID=UPI0030D0D008
MIGSWTDWRRFPDPRCGELLTAPFGPGVYDLRRRDTLQPVLFGIGSNVCARMASLLPEPLGCKGRNNSSKRAFVLEHLGVIEYRTMACETRAQAGEVERALPRQDYLFGT